jgi:hypothetical protein
MFDIHCICIMTAVSSSMFAMRGGLLGMIDCDLLWCGGGRRNDKVLD